MRPGEPKPSVTDPRGAVSQLGGASLPAFGAFDEYTQAPRAFDERHLFSGLEAIPDAPAHREVPEPRSASRAGCSRARHAEGDGVSHADLTGWSASGLRDPATTAQKT